VNKVLTLPRHPGDALRLVAGLAILLGCTATVRPHHVGVLETDLFRLANDLPDALLPAGWSVSDVFVRNGRVRFSLDSDRVGTRAVQVVLERYCTFGRVTRVPSDHPGTRRYQEVISIEPGRRYQGAIYYLFPGGCVTYRLDFRSDEQARPLGEVSLALGFVTRDALRQSLNDFTQGRVPLDPSQEPAR
jgi:hypothetical protein